MVERNFKDELIDVDVIAKVFTTIVRRERFAEGSMVSAYDSGLVLDLLEALETKTNHWVLT